MTPGDAETARFVIDGKDYPIPGIETFDMDEAMLLYDYAGITLEDFVTEEDEDEEAARERRLRHPGLLKTLLHVAYARGNPTLSQARVRTAIGQVNIIATVSAFTTEDTGDGDEGPPVSTPDSSPSSDGNIASSGSDSTDGSAEPASPPAPIGTTR